MHVIMFRSPPRALYWYEEIQDYDECAAEEGAEPEWGMSDPPYIILARQAEIRLMEDIQGMSKVHTQITLLSQRTVSKLKELKEEVCSYVLKNFADMYLPGPHQGW